MKWLLLVALSVALAFGAAPAVAHHPDGGGTSGDVVDGPVDTSDVKQHAGDEGHLPASAKNVKLVGKLDDLTSVEGGIADVGYHAGYAYLNAFSPECAGRPGAQGTGVHVVDASDPANPKKVGFLPAEPDGKSRLSPTPPPAP